MREITPGANPWGNGRSFKLGDNHWAVAALQINLNVFGNTLVPDGVFGPATDKVCRAFQRHRGLVVDGIIGPASQQRMCIDLATPAARRYGLPAGLARGIMESESGFMLSAWTEHPSDAGFDLGVWQDSYTRPASQASYAKSLNVSAMAFETCEKLRTVYNRYRNAGAVEKLAWECATLYHNWPAAADRLARGLGPTSQPDTPATWVQIASGGRLSTPREWANAYIENTTRYVLWPN